MAAARSEENFLCSICLDLLTEPVSAPCGHNFCRRCLSQHWDTSAPCRCPLCNELFHMRPELTVNLLLSEVVSELKQEKGSRPEVSKAGEVSCSKCSAPKLKAVKSCLLCQSSFCETHLQSHLSHPKLKWHQLMEPVENLEDRLCIPHHKPLELFCSSDHSLLCTMCDLLEHESHQIVSLKIESEQRKLSLQQTLKQKRQKIQELQSSVQLSQRAMDREKSTGLQAFSDLVESLQRSRDSFIQDLQDKQQKIETQAEALIQQLKQDICDLEKISAEAEDHILFLQRCPALLPTGLKDCSSVRLELQTFKGTSAQALCELQQSLEEIFTKHQEEIFTEHQEEIFTEHREKTTPPENSKEQELNRVQQFAVDLTLDPDSAHFQLCVSEDLKQVYRIGHLCFPDSPQRFYFYYNIVTKQSFSSGKFYFEVQVKDKTWWTLGVASESVDRKSCRVMNTTAGYWCFGFRNKNQYVALSDPCVPLWLMSAPQKVGVFVDYDEGLVSFYNVDTTDLLYSFTHCCFRDKLLPFLHPGYKSPLILSSVKRK